MQLVAVIKNEWIGPSLTIAMGIAMAMYLYATVALRSRYSQHRNLLNGKYKPLFDKRLQTHHQNLQFEWYSWGSLR